MLFLPAPQFCTGPIHGGGFSSEHLQHAFRTPVRSFLVGDDMTMVARPRVSGTASSSSTESVMKLDNVLHVSTRGTWYAIPDSNREPAD